MGCPKLTYHLSAKPRLRCVYNAADGESRLCFSFKSYHAAGRHCPTGQNGPIRTNGGAWQLHYIHRDYSGSIVAVSNSSGSAVESDSYDAWGRLRNASTLVPFARNAQPTLTLRRGYTGHEHLPEFGLINMNARLYDPVIGRFLSSDKYVQFPDFSQSYNRYSYALNNPLIYTDPDGEVLWLVAAAVYTLFFTDFGYDVQKMVSPVAVKIDVRLSSNQGGIGIEASVGIPQIFPVSYRVHGGATYFWKYEDMLGNDMSGWETRYGSEWGISGYMFGVPVDYTYGGTTYNSKWSSRQTVNTHMIGNPFMNLKYKNDAVPKAPFNWIPFVPKGDGDRYRTAAAEINVGPFGIGMYLITGDAGPDRNNYGNYYIDANGNKIYLPYDEYDPNQYRMGVLYGKVGPFKVGGNSEEIRHVFQNLFAHNIMTGGKTYWFEVLNLKPKWRWWWQFGGSLW